MATDRTLAVSGAVYLGALATGSTAPVTASQLGGSGLPTLAVSGALYLGALATGSTAPVTASQQGILTYPAALVNFQQPSTGSVVTGSGGSTPVFYVLTGWYAAGGSRETWGGNSVNTPPPSGHSLLDIIVMGSYPPQNSAT